VSANLGRTRALSAHSHDKTKFLWLPRRCFAGHHLGARRSGAPRPWTATRWRCCL